MEASLGPLLPLYERERAAGRPLGLGVLVHTTGSTYRKPGALILFAGDGEYAGLISGGCLEGDLREHAHTVIASGAARTVRYDMRSGEDALFGLGLGCEGAMHILLLQAGPTNGWQPLEHLAAALGAHRPAAAGLIVESSEPGVPVGSVVVPGPQPSGALGSLAAVQEALQRCASSGLTAWVERPSWRLFVLPLALPPRILVLGAGPDARPLADFAARLEWKVTVVDHREAYASPRQFPAAQRVLLARPETLAESLDLTGFAAAVVMSHQLVADLAYLRALAASSLPFVGLLGPAVRRERLLRELGEDAKKLAGRLHAPVGLPLGGRSPESIALAIVAQIHGQIHGIKKL